MTLETLPDDSWKFDPKSKEAVLQYGSLLKRRRDLALDKPLVHGGHLACYGPSLAETGASTSQCHHRPRSPVYPLLAQDSPLNHSTSLHLRLVEPIQSGPGNLSQVWRCQVERLGDTVQNLGLDVVLKIYQESLSDIPGWFHKVISPDGYEPIERAIRREANAYGHLRHVQGSIVPYSYGFFKFLLPCGEESVGHVMEYIPGSSLEGYAWKHGKEPETLLNAYFSALNSYHRLRLSRVLHYDVKLRNIMISPTQSDAIIIDFGSSQIMPDDTPATGTRGDIVRLSRECYNIPELGGVVQAWCFTHTDDARLEAIDYDGARQMVEACGEDWRRHLIT